MLKKLLVCPWNNTKLQRKEHPHHQVILTEKEKREENVNAEDAREMSVKEIVKNVKEIEEKGNWKEKKEIVCAEN